MSLRAKGHLQDALLRVNKVRTVPRINHEGRHNKRVVKLNYEPAMTFEEIGAALGVDYKTAFVIYARAMEKIRRELRRHADRYVALMQHEEAARGAAFPDWSTE